MKIIKQQTNKSYRAKQIDKFMERWFPLKPIGILIELKLKEGKNGKVNTNNPKV
jgi:hypothetical protein